LDSVTKLSTQIKLEVAQTCVHANLKRTLRQITQCFDGAPASSGLHITQFTLLTTCSLKGASSVGDLAAQLALDQTTLTRNLKILLRDGLVELKPSAQDARVRLVSITPAGEAAIARAYAAWRKAQREVTADLSLEEYRQLLSLLGRLQVAC